MAVTTSFFGNIDNVPSPLSISGQAPTWYVGPQFKVLAPKYRFYLAYKLGEIDAEGYTECYKSEVLGTLDPQETYDRIVGLAGPAATLLCYEQPGEFCHRRLVASWLEKALGLPVLEIPTPPFFSGETS